MCVALRCPGFSVGKCPWNLGVEAPVTMMVLAGEFGVKCQTEEDL